MAFFAICILLNTIFSHAQWVQQNTGLASPLYNIQFVNLLTGWATGSGSVILKTTDGGLNWQQQIIDLGYPKNLYGLSMLDANTGYIAGWFETILKTTNSGANWNIISNIPSNSGNSNSAASFVNSQTGWICSSLGRVLRTTNGGVSWDTSNVGNTGPLEDIQFVNPLTGWVCGDVGNLRKSTDGGITWTGTSLLTTANFDGLYFLNVNTGWTVGEQDNMVFKTTNSGGKWDTVAVLPGGSLQYSYVIYFSSALTGWIGGTNSRLFRTTDGGFNWVRENAVYLAFFSNLSFYNDSIGWAVGGHGTIIHTTTSGEPVGIIEVESSVPSGFNLYQNYPNPFNPSTNIGYQIEGNDYVILTVYDILGKEVVTLVNKEEQAGNHEVRLDGTNLASGIYFYKLVVKRLNSSEILFSNSRKMLLIK
jgi:photosystem II stability/assembly factor-like uncharacterized protein